MNGAQLWGANAAQFATERVNGARARLSKAVAVGIRDMLRTFEGGKLANKAGDDPVRKLARQTPTATPSEDVPAAEAAAMSRILSGVRFRARLRRLVEAVFHLYLSLRSVSFDVSG
jgi:hypothetical protein